MSSSMSFLAVPLLTIAGIITSLGIIYRGLVRPIYRWAKRLTETVTTVEAQMRPNGGSSLRDAIDNLTSSISRIDERLTFVEDHVTRPK
jgi:hypothetical protein